MTRLETEVYEILLVTIPIVLNSDFEIFVISLTSNKISAGPRNIDLIVIVNTRIKACACTSKEMNITIVIIILAR